MFRYSCFSDSGWPLMLYIYTNLQMVTRSIITTDLRCISDSTYRRLTTASHYLVVWSVRYQWWSLYTWLPPYSAATERRRRCHPRRVFALTEQNVCCHWRERFEWVFDLWCSCVITSAEEGGYVFRSVCLSVCPSDYSQTCERILTKFFVGVGHASRTKWYNFGGDPDHVRFGSGSPKSEIRILRIT